MSADLYISEIEETKHGFISVKMNAHGVAFITVGDPYHSESYSTFNIPPTPEGWKEATNLIGALQEWVRHTKELEEQRIWAEGLTKGMDR